MLCQEHCFSYDVTRMPRIMDLLWSSGGSHIVLPYVSKASVRETVSMGEFSAGTLSVFTSVSEVPK